MKFLDCPIKYVGQTGRTFYTRYIQYIQAVRINSSNSGYASHILNKGDIYGTIIDTIHIMKHTKRKTPEHI
jgi:hypothetical protein